MGLDMYLESEIGLSEFSFAQGNEGKAAHLREAIKGQYDDLMDQRNGCIGLSVKLPLAYWRKANHIHAWFVKHVQQGKDDCERYAVTREQLEELKKACAAVLADPSKAPELLPTQSGFFFGGTEYDEYYVHELEYTIDAINRIATKLPKGTDIYYQSSW